MNSYYVRHAGFVNMICAYSGHAGLVTLLGEIPCAEARKTSKHSIDLLLRMSVQGHGKDCIVLHL